MDDKEYFMQYKNSFEIVFGSNEDECAFVKDADFRYQAVTGKLVEYLGMDDAEDLLGKTLVDVAQEVGICDGTLIDQFMRQDTMIKRTKERRIYLEVLLCNGKNNISVSYKTPLINPDTNNFVGIRGHINKLILPHVIKTLFKMHGSKGLLISHKNNSKKNPLDDYPLTNIQHMVLFLALNNYSYSEIALLLSEFGHQVTPIRVNDYLEQLKFIFHVRNKNQLIEKAIGLNFHTFFPIGLFSKLASVEVSDEEADIIHSEEVISLKEAAAVS